MAPLIAAVVVAALFGLAEYYRSWLNFYSESEESFIEFGATRLALYYATALNNGAGFWAYLDDPVGPYLTAMWYWQFPLAIGQETVARLLDLQLDEFQYYLYRLAQPEFNNPSGLYSVFVDYGFVGGLIVWSVLGAISGRLYRSFIKHRPSGLLLYPVWYIGIIELLRVFSWGSTRYFPVLVGTIACLAVLAYARKRMHRRLSPRPIGAGALHPSPPSQWRSG
jgi:hypothetical protein